MMRIVQRMALPGIALALLAPGAVTLAAPAVADCTSSGGTTICSQGDVRGADTGQGPGSGGGYNPYVCGYDGWCDYDYGWGWDVDLDIDRPGGPGGPGIGGPGGPGGPGFGGGASQHRCADGQCSAS